jgi:hypothetical protein
LTWSQGNFKGYGVTDMTDFADWYNSYGAVLGGSTPTVATTAATGQIDQLSPTSTSPKGPPKMSFLLADGYKKSDKPVRRIPAVIHAMPADSGCPIDLFDILRPDLQEWV